MSIVVESIHPVECLSGISPEQVAAELSHLPGMIFLDSAATAMGDLAKSSGHFSIIFANPVSMIEGNLFCESDFQMLSQRLDCEENEQSTEFTRSETSRFLGAGLYGTIDYDGRFVFGEYREFLRYDHSQESWLEVGSLSSCRRPFPAQPDKKISFASEITQEKFCSMVEGALQAIAAGEIYQVNLSHRLIAPKMELDRRALFALYLRLRSVSPAPYAAYCGLGERTVLSSSPEEFLRISDRIIRTRPIKGTRPRFQNPECDESSASELVQSAKELAELTMITDLERNDLGQVCEYGSVTAPEMLKLERHAQVFHLVSTVEGILRRGTSHAEALRACFPGGSISGAPKRMAREMIATLEPCERGLYTGAIGGFGFNRESRFSIAIRTLIAERGLLHFHVGAGIVADSIPEKEWEETLHKAAGILAACGGDEGQ